MCCLAAASGPVAEASLVTALNPLARTISQQTATADRQINLADLQAVITARGDRTTAGVFDSENVTAAGNLTSAEPDYATAKFTLTGMARYGRNDAAAASTTTSGSRFGFVNGTETWTLGSRTSAGVTHFGATFCNWGSGALLTSVVATFSDDSTSTFTSTATSGQWVFVGFQAPASLTIKSVTVNESTAGNWVGFDDVAVVLASTSAPPLELTQFTIDPVTGFHTLTWPSVLGRTYRLEHTLDGTTWSTTEAGWDAQGDQTIYVNSKPPAGTVQKYRVITE